MGFCGDIVKYFFKSTCKANVKSCIFSADEFHHILERERYRADRYDSWFTLICFDTPKLIRSSEATTQLINVIISRKFRKTDEVGWMEDGMHIGVILYRATPHGAKIFAESVYMLMGGLETPLVYHLCPYPDKQGNDDSYFNDVLPPAFLKPEIEDHKRMGEKEALPVSQESKQVLPSSFQVSLNKSGANLVFIHKEMRIFVKSMPVWKRVIDIFGAAAGIVIFSPIMLLSIIAIKCSSKGPVIFKQHRCGIDCKPFSFYKFRSMCLDAETKKNELMENNEREGPVFKMSDDPRVTPVGRIIRKWSLDELPQLFNVLKGDMSLVGPRPPTMDEVPKYEKWQNRRLEIKPGITCLWQISARHDKCFKKWTRLDIDYIINRSFLLDLRILLKTVPAVLLHKGAC